MSQAAAAAASSAVGNDMRHHLGQHNGGGASGMPGHHTNQQLSQPDTLSPDLGTHQNLTLVFHGVKMYYCYWTFNCSDQFLESLLTDFFLFSSGEQLRLQEQRLEQALRLHGDPRALSFTLQHVVNQQSNQQPWKFSYYWDEWTPWTAETSLQIERESQQQERPLSQDQETFNDQQASKLAAQHPEDRGVKRKADEMSGNVENT